MYDKPGAHSYAVPISESISWAISDADALTYGDTVAYSYPRTDPKPRAVGYAYPGAWNDLRVQAVCAMGTCQAGEQLEPMDRAGR